MRYDILILGGGAAGMVAALAAAEAASGARIAVMEKNDRLGKKLATTGNGRCNITNREMSLSHFHGADRAFIRPALERFDLSDTLEFFDRLGVPIRFDERGRGYPSSLQAASVVDALRFRLEECGVTLLCGRTVSALRRGFSADTPEGVLSADRLIVTCGGQAAPRTGSDGAARLLRGFGHRSTGTYPAIVPLRTETAAIRPLKGVKVPGAVQLVRNGRVVLISEGEILFTDYGVSGPPVLDVSRAAVIGLEKGGRPELSLDFLPAHTAEEVGQQLLYRAAAFPKRPLAELFCGLLHKRLGQVIVKRAGRAISDLCGSLTPAEAEKMARLVCGFPLRVTGSAGFANAQTTAGGLLPADFFAETMESRLCPGLYAAGEVLDVDGDCGGYNLQWAWSSGRMAGRSAAESLGR